MQNSMRPYTINTNVVLCCSDLIDAIYNGHIECEKHHRIKKINMLKKRNININDNPMNIWSRFTNCLCGISFLCQ